MDRDLDALARDAASGALSRRQVLRRLGTGAGLALIALLGSVERTQTAWASTTAPCAGTVCGADCCTAEERCTNGRCTPANPACNGPGETRCGADCCTASETCSGGACVPR